jgi:hypothetical protein
MAGKVLAVEGFSFHVRKENLAEDKKAYSLALNV